MSNYRYPVSTPKGASVSESANRIISYFVGQGYFLKSDQRPRQATFSKDGSNLSWKDHKNPHEVQVHFSDSEISFHFKVTSFIKDDTSESTFRQIAERAKEEIVRKCSSCSEYVRADAKVCRFCQRSL